VVRDLFGSNKIIGSIPTGSNNILCGCACDNSISIVAHVVTLYQLKLCWNDIETGLQHIQQIYGHIRRVSRRIQQVSLIESSSQTYKYIRIRQLKYSVRIAPVSDTRYGWVLKNPCNKFSCVWNRDVLISIHAQCSWLISSRLHYCNCRWFTCHDPSCAPCNAILCTSNEKVPSMLDG
jgi:hypothetical protein